MNIEKLKEYLDNKLLNYHIEDGLLELNDKEYIIVSDLLDPIFDEEFTPTFLNEIEEDGWVYLFGGRYYLQHKESKESELIEVKNIGEAKQQLPTTSFLGIHSGFEIMNGMGVYKDWIKKAKFLGIKTLAICEKNTLAGALSFQSECIKVGIKPIIGMSVPIIRNSNNFRYEIKCYVKNFEGWLNLLKFNTLLNVDFEIEVDELFLKDNMEGLHIVLNTKETDFKEKPDFIKYYQLETVNYLNEDKDKEFIDNLERYLKSGLEPVSICDAYYIEKEDYITREVLWNIAKSYDWKTDNQFFKSKDQYAKELINLFEKGNQSYIKLFNKATQNEAKIVEECNYTYDTGSRRLPKYIMTPEESKNFDSNEDLFLHLIKIGFAEKKIKDAGKYVARLKEEIRVLKKGDVIDYFLSLYDIVKFAKENNILTGIGRGSAGGSLISYLLGLIQVDPLEFDLLFERFLNDGRMGYMEDRPAFIIETNEGELILKEGDIVRVLRNKKELVLFANELKENDFILKY